MTTPSPSLPNPFLDAQADTRSPMSGRFAARPALVVFLLCLVLGAATVAWRAKMRADDARAQASIEAQARGAALELQLNQVVSAAEVLGALARQSGGAIPNFQKAAAELLAARPGLTSLESQPGGIVNDIVPRAGNERGLGFNVLKDPAYQSGANAAIQKRALTVTGPLTLYRGVQGIVARVPVFQRARDGRDSFWGFVAASMRLSDALGRVRVDDLFKQGYSYHLFKPASASEKAETLAARGALSIQDAALQLVRVHDLEFRLALQPRGGWVNKTKVVLESLAALVVAGLLSLLVNLLESRRAVEAELAELNQRLARESAGRKQSQEDWRGAKDEAAAARSELERARSALQSGGELETRLNASVRAAEESAQARQAELEQARMAQEQAQQNIGSLQARLDTAARAGKKAAAALQTRLEAAQATIADLEVRLEGPTRLAAEASAAKVVPTEEADQEPSAQASKGESVPPHNPPEADVVPAPTSTLEPSVPAPPVPEATPTEATPPQSQPPAPDKPARVARRKKTRPINQIELFEVRPAAEQSVTGSLTDTPAEAPAAEAPLLPLIEPPAPSTAPVPEEPESPEKPVADAAGQALAAPEASPEPKAEKPARPLPAPPPVNPSQLRKAVNLIVPLFTGQDPGARDCLKANRTAFRSTFSPEGYVEFEQLVKNGDFDAALEQLKKAAKKHGIPV